MNIVIEGPDATGKSTLAHYIAARTGFSIVESEGPPRFIGDIADRIRHRLEMDNTIFVRHPVISHPIYEAARRASTPNSSDSENVSARHEMLFHSSKPLLIFCAPSGTKPHIEKPYDIRSHLDMVHNQAPLILALYRQWAFRRAHVLYRIGDDPERVLNSVHPFDPVRDVEEFHRKNLIQYDGLPRALDYELLQFRLKFLREETNELEKHAEAALDELDKLSRAPSFATGDLAFDNAHFVHELGQSLDALADLVYVALGTAHLAGFPFRSAWARVHRANMLKARAEGNAKTLEERVKLKMIKPPGWEPPKHDDLVEHHAHSQEHQS